MKALALVGVVGTAVYLFAVHVVLPLMATFGAVAAKVALR